MGPYCLYYTRLYGIAESTHTENAPYSGVFGTIAIDHAYTRLGQIWSYSQRELTLYFWGFKISQ